MLTGAELVHLGGGESLPCPDAELLPLTPGIGRTGLGTARLALPPARLHVLAGALVLPSSGVVMTPDGRVVAESVTTAMIGRVPLDDAERRADPVDVEGTVAVFRSPLRSPYHTLVDDLPRAGLLIHPAVGRLGNIDLLHDGELTDLESVLLPRLSGRRIRLREVEPGRPVRAERVVVPNFVTRPGAGAVPSWYRRWADLVPLPAPVEGAPRRIFLDAGSAGTAANRPALLDALERHGVEPVVPAEHRAADLLAVLRDADLVVGSADGGLAGCLFSRRTHLVELLDDITMDPAIYYLAASKGLPYDFVPTVGSTAGRRAAPRAVDIGWLDRLLDRVVA